MDDWRKASYATSPDSILQAVVLGLSAILLVGGLVLMGKLDVLSLAKWPEQDRAGQESLSHT